MLLAAPVPAAPLTCDTEESLNDSDSLSNEQVATHIYVEIVGHASPRWLAAQSKQYADDLNLKLSKQRTDSVKRRIEVAFRQELSGQKLVFEYNVCYRSPRDAGGSHQINAESRGSSETLREARGDRSINEPQMRRVDVATRLTFMVDGEAPSSHSYVVPVSEQTRQWAIQVVVSANVHITYGATWAYFKLKNRETGSVAKGNITAFGGGGGAKWSLWGVGYSLGSYRNFVTKESMDHNSFNGKLVRLTTLDLSLGYGYSFSYLTIYGVGSDAHSMFIGGKTVGTASASGSIDQGTMWVSAAPPKFKRVDKTEWERYSRDYVQEDSHVVLFDTQVATPSAKEDDLLRRFVAKVARDFRLDML